MTDATEKNSAGGSGGPALTAQIEALKDAVEVARNYFMLFHDEVWRVRLIKWEAALTLVGAGARVPSWTVYGEGCIRTQGLIVPVFDAEGKHSRALAKQLADLHNGVGAGTVVPPPSALFDIGVKAMTACSDPNKTAAEYRAALTEICNLALQGAGTVVPPAESRDLAPYQLPDGRLVLVDASAAKGAPLIDFTLADGSIVPASAVRGGLVT